MLNDANQNISREIEVEMEMKHQIIKIQLDLQRELKQVTDEIDVYTNI
jgi:hypothetical protein